MTAMFQNKTPGVVVAEIEMLRAVDSTTGFIVEGHDDLRFWKARTAPKVTLVDCEGKQNLLEVARQATAAGKDYIFGVYDADFDHLAGVRHFSDLLAITDENDLEIILLRSSSLDHFLVHFGEQHKIDAFEALHVTSIADYIEKVARNFGELRFLNHTERYGVDFDKLSPYRFISPETWQLDDAALRDHFSQLAGITLADLLIKLSALGSYGQWALVQGHDCVRVLTQGMKKALSNRYYSESDVTRMLALSFDDAKLSATRMYADLTQIEARCGIDILRC